jgi:hypothetical protein
MKNKRLIVLFTLCILLLTVLPTLNIVSASSWFDDSFTYQKNCYITNKFLGYQQKIVVGKSTGGNVSCGGHCNNNFSDIRFVRNNATLLNYWMENYTSGIQATFWYNNSYNDSCISMYYGKSTATSISNGTLTFLLFDDFLGTSLNTTKWKTTGILNPNFRNSEMFISTLNTNKYISSYKTFSQNTSLQFKAHNKVGERGDTVGYGINNPAPYYTPPNFVFNSGGATVVYFNWCNNAAYSGSGTVSVTSVYKRYELNREGATKVIGRINGTNYMESTTNTPRTAMNISIGKGAGSEQSNLTIDWIFVSTIRVNRQIWSSFGAETTRPAHSPININNIPVDSATCLSFPILSIYVSDIDNDSMNHTFRSNFSGAWQILKYTNNTLNATITYTGTYPYNQTIFWSSNVTDNTSRWDNDTYSFYIVNVTTMDCNASDLWLYLGAMLTLDNGQFFLLILIGLWSYFIYLFYKEKEVIFSFCIICCGLPLGIILSGVAYYNSYPFGYLISFILILISFLIPTYAMYKKNKKKN